MNDISKFLIIAGVISIVAGIFWHYSNGNIPLGKLPGDIRIDNGNTKFYFPITSCLLVSGVLSLVMYFFRK